MLLSFIAALKACAQCMHCECWIPVYYDATIGCERTGKVGNGNPGYLKAL